MLLVIDKPDLKSQINKETIWQNKQSNRDTLTETEITKLNTIAQKKRRKIGGKTEIQMK